MCYTVYTHYIEAYAHGDFNSKTDYGVRSQFSGCHQTGIPMPDFLRLVTLRETCQFVI